MKTFALAMLFGAVLTTEAESENQLANGTEEEALLALATEAEEGEGGWPWSSKRKRRRSKKKKSKKHKKKRSRSKKSKSKKGKRSKSKKPSKSSKKPTKLTPPVPAEIDLHNEDEAKCYRGKFFDIPGNVKAADHFKDVGVTQGRYWGCGKKLSNIEAQTYIDLNPRVQIACGIKGESSLKAARKDFSRHGRLEKENLLLRDPSAAPFVCSQEHQLCQCAGTIHYGYQKRPDTGEAITEFDALNDFATLSLDADGDVLKCDSKTFGNDPAVGHPKQCFCEPKPEKKTARVCSEEGGDCSCSKGSVVMYGRHDSLKVAGGHAHFAEAQLNPWTGLQVSGSDHVKCDSSSFEGVDPLPGLKKSCFCDDAHNVDLTYLHSQQRYWKAQMKKKASVRMKASAMTQLTSISREVQKTVSRVETTRKTVTTTSETSGECGEVCVTKTAHEEAEIKKKVIKEKYTEKTSQILQQLEVLNQTITTSEQKKTSAEKVKQIAEKSKNPADQVKLKQEYEKINDEANQEEIKAKEKIEELEEELENLQEEEQGEVSGVDSDAEKQIQEQTQKTKLHDATNKEEKAKLDKKTNKAKEDVLTKEVETQKLADQAVKEEIDATQEEVKNLEENNKQLQKQKDKNEEEIANVDGGAAIEAEKQAENEKAITDLQNKLAKDKADAAKEIATNTAEVTKTEVEIGELNDTIAEKQTDLQKAKEELAKHKVQIQEATNHLDMDPKNKTAQKQLQLVKEQTTTDKEIIDQTEKALKKVVGEKGLAEEKISKLNNETRHIENKTETDEINLTNEIGHKTQNQVDHQEEKEVDTALEQKEKALETKLQSDVQQQVAKQTQAQAETLKAEVEEESKKQKDQVTKNKKKQDELQKKKDEVASKPTTDPKQKAQEVKQIEEEIKQIEDENQQITEQITKDETTVKEAEVQAQAEKQKADALKTEAESQEKIYTSTIGSNKQKDEAQLNEVKNKNKAAKETAQQATKTATETKNTQNKVIETTKNKIKSCEQRMKEADTNLKVLYSRRAEVIAKIGKLSPAQKAKSPLSGELATVEGDITKNKATLAEMTTCIQTGITEESKARTDIIQTQEAANEAQLIAKQTQQIEELVTAQVNQSVAIENEIEGELKKEFNQTSEKVKQLVKEQTALNNDKRTAEKHQEEASEKIDDAQDEIDDLTQDVIEKTAEKEKLQNELADPANAANAPAIQGQIDTVENEIKADETTKTHKQQEVNKAEKELEDATQAISDIETKNDTVIDQIDDAKFDLAQNATDKTYKDTKLKKDKTAVQKEIDQVNQGKTHAQEKIKDIQNQEDKAQQTAKEHKQAQDDQQKILDQLKTQLEAVEEATSKKVTPDPIDTENASNLKKKIDDATQAVEENKAIVEEEKKKAETLENKKKEEQAKIKDADSKASNLEKKKENIENQVNQQGKVKNKQKEQIKKMQNEHKKAQDDLKKAEQELNEANQDKDDLIKEQDDLNTETNELTKKLADEENKEKQLRDSITQNTTMTPEDVKEVQKQINEVQAEKQKTQAELSSTESAKEEAAEELSNVESEIQEKQEEAAEAAEEAKETEQQATEVKGAVEKDNSKVVNQTLEENKAISEEMKKNEEAKDEAKKELEQAKKEKETIEKNLQNDQAELENAKKNQETAEHQENLSMCQAYFYSLPEAQRAALFKYTSTSTAHGAGETEGLLSKCPSGQVYHRTNRIKLVATSSQTAKVKASLKTLVVDKQTESFIQYSKAFNAKFDANNKRKLRKIRNKTIFEFNFRETQLDLCQLHQKVNQHFPGVTYTIDGIEDKTSAKFPTAA